MIIKKDVMEKLFSFIILLTVFSILLVIPVSAVTAGIGVTPNITTLDTAPNVWMCDSRVVYDDATAPGRISAAGTPLVERFNNYAFEGENIMWRVLVMDANGPVVDVRATLGPVLGTNNTVQASCVLDFTVVNASQIDDNCNALVNGIVNLSTIFISNSSPYVAYYNCTFTVETPLSMYGEYWITVEAEDSTGMLGIMDENEFWFLNPVIALALTGAINFVDVTPGATSYSTTLTIENDADVGSGVMLDMFITGTDFFASSGVATCPTSNTLTLDNFRYYVTNGAYNSAMDDNIDSVDADRSTDVEGYTNIEYGTAFNVPSPFYNNTEILQTAFDGTYWAANLLAPGAEMSLTFKLELPSPCIGDFDTGDIFFWGEAV